MKNLQKNFDNGERERLVVDEEYLQLLGLTDADAKDRLWPDSPWQKAK